jgi:hypothetical protein
VVFVCGAGALGAGAFACGLDVAGEASGDGDGGGAGASGVGASDASLPRDDAGFPAACPGIDASCLGAIPAPWTPLAVTGGACAAGFEAATLVVGPRVGPGACACGPCVVTGPLTCAGNTAIRGGDGCKDSPIAQAPPGVCTQAHAEHLRADPPKATGSPPCFAPNDAGAGATADPFPVCVPGCDADFCATPEGARCVVAEGDLACPAGFTLRARAGTAADPGCAPCACTTGKPGDCAGVVTAFDTNDCSDAGTVATYALRTCNEFEDDNDDDYDSVRVDLVPPDASCTVPPTHDPGDAGLVGARTICCR